MFYDMAVKQRHGTGVGGYWYKGLAVTARMRQCLVFPRERLLLQDDKDSVLRTEAVAEKGASDVSNPPIPNGARANSTCVSYDHIKDSEPQVP